MSWDALGTFASRTGATALGGAVALPPGMLGYDYLKATVFKKPLPHMNMSDEFHGRIMGDLDKALKKNEWRKFKMSAAFSAAFLALNFVPLVLSSIARKATTGRQQVAAGIERAGEKTASHIQEAAQKSAKSVA
jgi:hypothetical protein